MNRHNSRKESNTCYNAYRDMLSGAWHMTNTKAFSKVLSC